MAATTKPLMAMKYEAEVGIEGKLELRVPLAAGDRVVVFVIPESAESFQDLSAAAQSSLDFWNNPLDDEDWNHA